MELPLAASLCLPKRSKDAPGVQETPGPLAQGEHPRTPLCVRSSHIDRLERLLHNIKLKCRGGACSSRPILCIADTLIIHFSLFTIHYSSIRRGRRPRRPALINPHKAHLNCPAAIQLAFANITAEQYNPRSEYNLNNLHPHKRRQAHLHTALFAVSHRYVATRHAPDLPLAATADKLSQNHTD